MRSPSKKAHVHFTTLFFMFTGYDLNGILDDLCRYEIIGVHQPFTSWCNNPSTGVCKAHIRVLEPYEGCKWGEREIVVVTVNNYTMGVGKSKIRFERQDGEVEYGEDLRKSKRKPQLR